MNRFVLMTGLAACFAGTVFATERIRIDSELNGLDVEAEVVGSISEAGAATAGVQVLQISNNDDRVISCEIEPAATDMAGASQATIEPGASANLQLGDDYASATTRARLRCVEAEEEQ